VTATSQQPGRWWHLDLASGFPELEIYSGHGWRPEQELGLAELGERVMDEEALWMFTRIYSRPRDRHLAAASGMFRMVIERVRRDRSEDERVLRVLAGEDPDAIRMEDVPAGWRPDARAWDEGRY
jgi:hypothetical protein